MSRPDDDRPAGDPCDPLKRDLPSEALGSGYGGVQGLRYGRATRGMMFEERWRASAGRHFPRRDERIRDDVAERLYHSPELDASDVSIDVKDGIVMLEGTVPGRRMKHAIENIAADTRGVRDVDNRVRVTRAPMPGSDAWQGAAHRQSPAAERPPIATDEGHGRPGTREHEEWLIDESIEESFPASDPPSATQPGSIAAEEQSGDKR